MPGDVAAIEAIVEAAYGGYVDRIGMRPGPMDADHRGQVESGQVQVAEDEDGQVVGLLVCDESPGALLVENVAVRPDRHGEGLGRLLLDHAEDEARAAGLGKTRLYTHSKMVESRAIYAHLGYRETDRRDEAGFARVFLEKDLS